MTLLRHGRACPGHPRLASTINKKDVDARDTGVRKHAVHWTAMRGHDVEHRGHR